MSNTSTTERNCDNCRHTACGSNNEPCVTCLMKQSEKGTFGTEWESAEAITPPSAATTDGASSADAGRGGTILRDEPPRPLTGSIVIVLAKDSYTRDNVVDIVVALGARVLHA